VGEAGIVKNGLRLGVIDIDVQRSLPASCLLQTLQQRERLPRILVTTTAAPASDHVARARRMGAEVFFMRPLDIDVLERTVAGLIARPASGDPAPRPIPVSTSNAT